jgi:hypothetical protein
VSGLLQLFSFYELGSTVCFFNNTKSNYKNLGFRFFTKKEQKCVQINVADPGFLFRIRIVPSLIQGQKDFGARLRIRIKEFKYF